MLINSAPWCQISVVGTLLPRARENCSVEMLLHLEHSRLSGHREVYSSGTKESADDKRWVGAGRVLKEINNWALRILLFKRQRKEDALLIKPCTFILGFLGYFHRQ